MLHETNASLGFSLLRSTAERVSRRKKQSLGLASLSHGETKNVGGCAPVAVRLGTAVTAAVERPYGVQHVTTTPTNSDDATAARLKRRAGESREDCASAADRIISILYVRATAANSSDDRSYLSVDWRQTEIIIEMFVIYKCKVHTSQ